MSMMERTDVDVRMNRNREFIFWLTPKKPTKKFSFWLAFQIPSIPTKKKTFWLGFFIPLGP
jgi:hypothetical protein